MTRIFTNGGKGADKKWIIKIKKEIRVHSCSFVAEIPFLERHISLTVKPQSLFRRVAPGKLFRLRNSLLAQFGAEEIVAHDFDQGLRQRMFVVRVNQQGRAAGDF